MQGGPSRVHPHPEGLGWTSESRKLLGERALGIPSCGLLRGGEGAEKGRREGRRKGRGGEEWEEREGEGGKGEEVGGE